MTMEELESRVKVLEDIEEIIEPRVSNA